jgi:hypothetical protein
VRIAERILIIVIMNYPDLFMKGLRGAFPGFVLGAKKAMRGLREDGRSLEE